jgi:hypothetical protein
MGRGTSHPPLCSVGLRCAGRAGAAKCVAPPPPVPQPGREERKAKLDAAKMPRQGLLDELFVLSDPIFRNSEVFIIESTADARTTTTSSKVRQCLICDSNLS